MELYLPVSDTLVEYERGSDCRRCENLELMQIALAPHSNFHHHHHHHYHYNSIKHIRSMSRLIVHKY